MLGYPGAGKTTTAKVIHELTGAEHLWADKERHKRYGNPTHSHEENIDLYNHLNQVADKMLSEGKSVIFDTNFNFYKDRQRLKEIAQKHEARTILIWITTPVEVAQKRAVEDSHGKHTRIWGNMPLKDFRRISSGFQPPHEDENTVEFDGTRITPEYVKERLNLHNE